MKDVSQDYIDKEIQEQRQPVELYHIWVENASIDWYYTSGDAPVEYGSHTYVPAVIKRGEVSYNSELEVSTLSVTLKHVDDVVVRYLALNPVRPTWISVMKLHRDQSPLEADVIFVGQIKNVPFKGNTAEAYCVGFEHFLKMPIPVWRYQLTCNHTLFDEDCGLNSDSYKVSATVTEQNNGSELVSSVFGTYSDGYFFYGFVEYGDEVRPIVNHLGNVLYIPYPFVDSPDGQSVDVYPGCDGLITTCRDKFNNISHYLGFPFTPQENPAMRLR